MTLLKRCGIAADAAIFPTPICARYAPTTSASKIPSAWSKRPPMCLQSSRRQPTSPLLRIARPALASRRLRSRSARARATGAAARRRRCRRNHSRYQRNDRRRHHRAVYRRFRCTTRRLQQPAGAWYSAGRRTGIRRRGNPVAGSVGPPAIRIASGIFAKAEIPAAQGRAVSAHRSIYQLRKWLISEAMGTIASCALRALPGQDDLCRAFLLQQEVPCQNPSSPG